MSVPFDKARCTGAGAPLCQTCRRREPGDVFQWKIGPEWTEEHGCPNYIEPLPIVVGAGTGEKE